jgi:hypothetical protein
LHRTTCTRLSGFDGDPARGFRPRDALIDQVSDDVGGSAARKTMQERLAAALAFGEPDTHHKPTLHAFPTPRLAAGDPVPPWHASSRSVRRPSAATPRNIVPWYFFRIVLRRLDDDERPLEGLALPAQLLDVPQQRRHEVLERARIDEHEPLPGRCTRRYSATRTGVWLAMTGSAQGLAQVVQQAQARLRGLIDQLVVYRLGRSLADLALSLKDLHSAGRGLYLHVQGMDTTTPSGRAMFQISGQTVENQRLELERVAAARGWTIGPVYRDEGISGAKGRDERPGDPRARERWPGSGEVERHEVGQGDRSPAGGACDRGPHPGACRYRPGQGKDRQDGGLRRVGGAARAGRLKRACPGRSGRAP